MWPREKRCRIGAEDLSHSACKAIIWAASEMFNFFVVVLKHWQLDFAKNDTGGEVLFVSHTHDLQGFIYNRLWSSFPFLHLADWPFLSCDTESVHVSGPGRGKKEMREVHPFYLPLLYLLHGWLKPLWPGRAGYWEMQAVQVQSVAYRLGWNAISGQRFCAMCIREQWFCRWKHMTLSS